MNTPEYWINRLQLTQHEEGGWYKETYRSEITAINDLPKSAFQSERSFCTAIYFLLQKDEKSHFHKIKSDEMWHFYYGSPIRIHIISPNGKYSTIIVGIDNNHNIVPQAIVPANYWFAAECIDHTSFSLVGCTVSPGFDFSDFILASRESLTSEYSHLKDLICRFTR